MGRGSIGQAPAKTGAPTPVHRGGSSIGPTVPVPPSTQKPPWTERTQHLDLRHPPAGGCVLLKLGSRRSKKTAGRIFTNIPNTAEQKNLLATREKAGRGSGCERQRDRDDGYNWRAAAKRGDCHNGTAASTSRKKPARGPLCPPKGLNQMTPPGAVSGGAFRGRVRMSFVHGYAVRKTRKNGTRGPCYHVYWSLISPKWRRYYARRSRSMGEHQSGPQPFLHDGGGAAREGADRPRAMTRGT